MPANAEDQLRAQASLQSCALGRLRNAGWSRRSSRHCAVCL